MKRPVLVLGLSILQTLTSVAGSIVLGAHRFSSKRVSVTYNGLVTHPGTNLEHVTFGGRGGIMTTANVTERGLRGKQIDFVPVEGLPSDRFIIDYRLGHIATPTASHCAVECQQNDACIMFQYTALTKSCQLYYDEITEDSNYIHYAYGPQVYKAYCSPVKDYLYYRTLDMCLHRHRDRQNFTAARDACFREGGTLFEPQTLPRMNFYQQYISQRFWVGGYGDSVTGAWFWFTGDEIRNTSSLWLPGKPSGGFDNPCLEAKIGAANIYGLNDRNCSYTREFFCQIEF